MRLGNLGSGLNLLNTLNTLNALNHLTTKNSAATELSRQSHLYQTVRRTD